MIPQNAYECVSSSPKPTILLDPTDIDLSSILIVEDDPDFLALLAHQISKISQTHMTFARSRDEALAQLAGQIFHLVICDWALEACTAPEIFQLADPIMPQAHGQLERKIPVMFMSGSEKIASTQNLRYLKCFEPVTFILKGLGPPLIRIMADNILERFQAPKSDASYAYLS